MKFSIEGMADLQDKLMDNVKMKAVRQIVKTNGAELNRRAVRNAVFSGNYTTGQTRRSINTQLSRGGLRSVTQAETSYAPYVELGTRFMSAQPFMRPAFWGQYGKFIEDIERLMGGTGG